MPRRSLPKRRTATLAREFRESSRVGPRVWALVGLALVAGLIFPQSIWISLALWLVFVFPLAVGGLLRWALAETIRKMATAAPVRRAPAPPNERVVTGRVVS